MNSFMIDGVDNNQFSVTGPQTTVIQDAVAEFTLLTNNFNAEFGSGSGGQFKTITKSGTNEYSGNVFGYLQHQKLNAASTSQERANQDDWKVTQNLTLNLGLRYEYVTLPRDAALQALNPISDQPGFVEFGIPKTDKNNFAPRVGFAYSPDFDGGFFGWAFGRRGASSIRANFSVSYGEVFGNLTLLTLPPQFQQELRPANVPGFNTAPGFLARGGLPSRPNPPSTAAAARAASSSFTSDFIQPETFSWAVSFQRELGRTMALELRYLGTRHLPVQLWLNPGIPVVTDTRFVPTFFSQPTAAQLAGLPAVSTFLTARRLDNPAFGILTTFDPVGNSQYDGVAANVTRRFSRGFAFTASYTFSKTISDSDRVGQPLRQEPARQLDAERHLPGADGPALHPAVGRGLQPQPRRRRRPHHLQPQRDAGHGQPRLRRRQRRAVPDGRRRRDDRPQRLPPRLRQRRRLLRHQPERAVHPGRSRRARQRRPQHAAQQPHLAHRRGDQEALPVRRGRQVQRRDRGRDQQPLQPAHLRHRQLRQRPRHADRPRPEPDRHRLPHRRQPALQQLRRHRQLPRPHHPTPRQGQLLPPPTPPHALVGSPPAGSPLFSTRGRRPVLPYCAATSSSILFAATAKYCSSRSKPTKRLPNRAQATPVVPLPQNGSRIKSPGLVEAVSTLSNSASGFCVGCFPYRFSRRVGRLMCQKDGICFPLFARRISS
jgi:hypothetical protein